MSQPKTSQECHRTIRLQDAEIAAILDRLDLAPRPPAEKRGAERFRYRTVGVLLHLRHSSTGANLAYLIHARNISETGLTFIHGGFIYPGTDCAVELFTRHGTARKVEAKVARCRLVHGNIHEMGVRFCGSIDPADYCPEAASFRVLLVEDEPSQLRLAAHHLKHLRAQVDLAENGREAVGKALENAYDFILLNMEVPVLDGYEAVKTLRNANYRGTIIAITGQTEPDTSERCISAGCDRYLPKPYTRQQLTEVLGGDQEDCIYSSIVDPDMTDLIKTFVAEMPVKIRKMKEALAAQNTKTLQHLVRVLKADGVSYGFEAITLAASTAESVMPQGPSTEAFQKSVTALIKKCAAARVAKILPAQKSPPPAKADSTKPNNSTSTISPEPSSTQPRA